MHAWRWLGIRHFEVTGRLEFQNKTLQQLITNCTGATDQSQPNAADLGEGAKCPLIPYQVGLEAYVGAEDDDAQGPGRSGEPSTAPSGRAAGGGPE